LQGLYLEANINFRLFSFGILPGGSVFLDARRYSAASDFIDKGLSAVSIPTAAASPIKPPRKAYVRTVGPRLRVVLYIVFGLVAALGANSLYLSAITFLDWWHGTGQTYQNYFYLYMFLAHLGLGLLLVIPYCLFGVVHLLAARKRRNRTAVRIGYALFGAGIGVLVTGVLLMRVGDLQLKHPLARASVYWAHIALPLAAGWLYWLHRLAGPRIKWRVGIRFGALTGVCVVGMVLLHAHDPRKWNVVGPAEGEKYFLPSLARTATGNFIAAETLMKDDYCLKCHKDAYQDWFHSAHHFSSFNNPAYLASVRETRQVSFKRDGSMQAARWCAGCHDPVPFFSGAFDDPNFDDVRDKTAQAGITCTTCHSITHINSMRGNADYTIEEPLHYPFVNSTNPVLQWLNQKLVKAKPQLHKQTFLKPLHKTAEFCSTCHKVNIPLALNHYKEFLRGQNHYDPYLLSGVSGHGARSFYYPPKAVGNCAGCHMPPKASNDFGARVLPIGDQEQLGIHDHFFPAANTALPWLRTEPEGIAKEQAFLKDVMRIDLFGIKQGSAIDGPLTAPLRPAVPKLTPGRDYVLETVIRTLKMGHPFTQGTVDSNEVWVEVTATSGGRVIGRSGAQDDRGEVDPWSHFLNVFMLDRDGNRISRRNPQDIFVPLYNHQIPPGAAQAVHFGLTVPPDVVQPVTVEVKLQYRKFDYEYMKFATEGSHKQDDLPIRDFTIGDHYQNTLPITTLAVDRLTFPVGVDGVAPAADSSGKAEKPAGAANPESPIPLWQRWNDYGIGLLLEGSAGDSKGELRQAAEAFAQVERLKRFDGPLNLARVYYAEGRLDEATAAIQRARQFTDPPAYPWTMAWLSGLINRQQGHLDDAEANFRSVLEDRSEEMRQKGFDFSLDYEVINEYGQTLLEQAKRLHDPEQQPQREKLLRDAAAQFEKTLTLDSENVAAHYNLQVIYGLLGDEVRAAEHEQLHARYKPDENARDRSIALARQKYPAANHAAETVVIHSLNRPQASGTKAAGN
jgi:tetratricopeptide (TPR) repeat protein